MKSGKYDKDPRKDSGQYHWCPSGKRLRRSGRLLPGAGRFSTHGLRDIS